jgi:hypothetical protein
MNRQGTLYRPTCGDGLPAPNENDTEIGPGQGKVLVEGNRSPQVLLCVLEISALEGHQAEIRAGLSESWVVLEGEVKARLGIVELPLSEQPGTRPIVAQRLARERRAPTAEHENDEKKRSQATHLDLQPAYRPRRPRVASSRDLQRPAMKRTIGGRKPRERSRRT